MVMNSYCRKDEDVALQAWQSPSMVWNTVSDVNDNILGDQDGSLTRNTRRFSKSAATGLRCKWIVGS